jgi:peptidyl-dipeptidase A
VSHPSNSHRRLASSIVVLLGALAGIVPVACGGAPKPALPEPAISERATTTASSGPPTVDEAQKFMTQVDKDLRRLWIARDRAMWVNQTFITDDTEALSAAGEEVTAEYVTKAIQTARRFDPIMKSLPADVQRQFLLLKLAQTVPAPSDAKEREELAAIEVSMTGAYGKAKYCPPRLAKEKPDKQCLTLPELSKIIAKSRNYDELLEAWTGWHSTSPPIKDKYTRYVELGNKGAKEIGFSDMGAMWRAGYDMPPAEFEADIERLWQEVKPLYDELHCYVRGKLREKYGADKVPEHAPIPAHLLGNMWAQEWNNIYDVVVPYKGEASLDITPTLKAKKYDAVKMVKLGEAFFTSLGFDKLPTTFWERSLFTKPKDREVVCHASAWDPTWSNDLRIKMCIEPTEEDLITIHHELGHDFYFHQYFKLPVLFQQGANDGFHEGIGDTLALSVTPSYLKGLGLLAAAPDNPKAAINQQMKMALDKVSFLPFGLLIDKWRWDVLAGKTPKDKYNASWWDLRAKYQGVSAPTSRNEATDFDPGAKFHVPASTPYIRYFLARIYQFQFHRALCKAAGHTGPLDKCSIYGNKEAGKRLMDMLAMGASKPWPEALAAMSGEKKADASALLEYFAPLREYLKTENKSQKCGW